MDRSKLLWMDLEMTGLDPDRDKIVEVACIVTDYDLNELSVYETALNIPSEEVDQQFARNSEFWLPDSKEYKDLREHMSKGKPEKVVVNEVLAFINTHFPKGGAVLSGNSIHQDRRFIRSWWPEVDALLSYRMLDVSSFKIIMENNFNIMVTKSDTHRALSDVRESIDELKQYLKRLEK